MDFPALDRIARKLDLLREQDAQPFGLSSHGLQLHPPLTEEEVAAHETACGARFPDEYRAFVTRLGDGGAGPAFGVMRLASALRWSKLDEHPDLLRLPFPHTAAYNPDKDPEVLAFWNRADAGEVTETEEDRFDALHRAGCLELCDEGGGYLHFLVVTGSARGTMWIDARGSDAGFQPLGVGFLEWYERWADDVLAGGHGTWWLGPPVPPPGSAAAD